MENLRNGVKIAAIVVTYNRKELLADCIECLINQSQKCDIIVIDNASTDGTCDYIESFIKKGEVLYFNTGENLGGAGGFHFGIKKVLEMCYDYVWIMDDDSMPEENALKELYGALYMNKEWGYVSSEVYWVDGSLCRMNLQRNVDYKLITNSVEVETQVLTSTFVSLLIPARTIYDVGLPIKEFFIWADDAEYTRRISMKYKCYMIPKSKVTHRCASNIGGNIVLDSEERLSRYKYAFRNDTYVSRREGIFGIIKAIARIPYYSILVLFKAKTKKWERIKIIHSSTIKGFAFNPPIEYLNEGKSASLTAVKIMSKNSQ